MWFYQKLRAGIHDPLRLAEDIAVLDLASGGRFVVTAGIGYRESEYAAHGKDWAARGALQDEAIDTMLKAWTGEPFEWQGRTIQATPKPFSQPHPTILVGGGVEALRRETLVHRYLADTNRLAPLEIELGVSSSLAYRAVLYLRRNRRGSGTLPGIRAGV